MTSSSWWVRFMGGKGGSRVRQVGGQLAGGGDKEMETQLLEAIDP
jgi:hypothetical protein